MTVEYQKDKNSETVKVCENYFLGSLSVVEQKDLLTVIDNCLIELEQFIDSDKVKKAVTKAKKLNNNAFVLMTDDRFIGYVKKAIKDTNDMEEKNNIINDILKRYAGAIGITNSYDYWNCQKAKQLGIAKSNVKLLKEMKKDIEETSIQTIEDVFKDLKISSE